RDNKAVQFTYNNNQYNYGLIKRFIKVNDKLFLAIVNLLVQSNEALRGTIENEAFEVTHIKSFKRTNRILAIDTNTITAKKICLPKKETIFLIDLVNRNESD
uniref:Uncharacterized protein n=1 Tax=Clytia hemisphaerica TaxID=252671 RepID=A0A7M5V2F2_9CNID